MPFTKGETNNTRERNINIKKILKTEEKEKEQIEPNDPVTASL